MKKFFNKTAFLRGGVVMAALVVAGLGFNSLNGNLVNDQAEIKLRDVARVEASSAFAIHDALANNEPVASETITCSENESGCTAKYNDNSSAVIKGKKP